MTRGGELNIQKLRCRSVSSRTTEKLRGTRRTLLSGMMVLVGAGSMTTSVANAELQPVDPVALIGQVAGVSITDAQFEVIVWPRERH